MMLCSMMHQQQQLYTSHTYIRCHHHRDMVLKRKVWRCCVLSLQILTDRKQNQKHKQKQGRKICMGEGGWGRKTAHFIVQLKFMFNAHSIPVPLHIHILCFISHYSLFFAFAGCCYCRKYGTMRGNVESKVYFECFVIKGEGWYPFPWALNSEMPQKCSNARSFEFCTFYRDGTWNPNETSKQNWFLIPSILLFLSHSTPSFPLSILSCFPIVSQIKFVIGNRQGALCF